MPAPEQPIATDTLPSSEPDAWDEADVQALMASAGWLDLRAPSELLAQYQGKHIAVYGDQIIAAGTSADALYDRIKSDGVVPITRVYVRYVPTPEEAWQRLWIH